MAKTVEGCWYSLAKAIPGMLSRYSRERIDEVDILADLLRSASCLSHPSCRSHSIAPPRLLDTGGPALEIYNQE